MTKDVSVRRLSRPWYRPSLTTQIIIGLIVGVAVGWIRPEWGNNVYFLRDIFLNLIKSIIGPLVFSTLVVGIAGGGDLRKVGRMGVKALIYFEIITTLALFLGLAVVNITKPGVGVPLAGAAGEAVQKIGETHPRTFVETLVHIFPASVVDSLVRGDILQIVAFAVLFAMAVSAIGEKGRPMLVAMESLSQVMFKLTNYVMQFAPFGVAAAMAHTIGTQGPGVLISLGNLIASYYLAITSVFIVEAAEPVTHQHFGFGQQLTMMLAFVITSKGLAGVPRASILVLLATLSGILPPPVAASGVAIVLGIDAIMDMGRSATNLIGNCLATAVIARWEGEFDDERAQIFGTPQEAELDLQEGDVAAAEIAQRGE